MWQVFEAILDFLSPSRRYEREKLGQELQELVTTGIPQAYLRNPEAALRRWGKPAWNAWLGITEPKYRLTSGPLLTGVGGALRSFTEMESDVFSAGRMD